MGLMLQLTLSSFTNALSNHLKMVYGLRDDIVSLGLLSDEKSTVSNKVIVSLINIERETASGIKFNYKSVSSNDYKKTKPGWQLNLYVVIAAVFSEKQYEEGLRLLSGSLLFMQNNNVMDLPGANTTVSLEPVNLSFSELSNLWSICGSTYYPSILCKMRVLDVNAEMIDKVVKAIKKEDVSL